MPKRGVRPAPPADRVLDAIRRGHRTVNALARALGVTDNAVRAHLAALERDGAVRRASTVRSGGAGQPAVLYEATPAAETALSRAYPVALGALARELREHLSARAMRAAFRAAGRKLAPDSEPPATLGAAARAARETLEHLGGRPHIRVADSHAELSADGCPLGVAVAAEPITCSLVESLLETRTGRPVEQHCEHGERPRCRFRIAALESD